MLTELHIKNFAIIDNLTVRFGAGFNIFTGETGAGKSIIIDAVALILGDRASNDIVRTSAEEAEVEALFDVSSCAGRAVPDAGGVEHVLREAGIPHSDSLIIKRVIQKAGRNRIYINGSLATLVTLTEVGMRLIDICGQSEHQSLTRPEEHIEALDAFGGFFDMRARMHDAYAGYYFIKKELDDLLRDSKDAAGRKDMLAFQSKEIGDAGLRPGMEEAFLKRKDMLRNAERIKAAAVNAENIIYSDSGSVMERLGSVIKSLRDVAAYDDKLKKAVEVIEAGTYQIEDTGAYLRDYSKTIEFDPDELEQTGARLDEINKLKKKYGTSIDEILARKKAFDDELNGLTNFDDRRKELEKALKAERDKAEAAAEKLSKARHEAAGRLKGKIEDELKGLGMKGTIFDVKVDTEMNPNGSLRFGEKGADRVSFLLSTNPGEAARPLARIASGGELSRIMLSMKRATLSGRVSTVVFDEIDAGVSGATAQAVGLKLKEVSRAHQVICITHLPQIAAFADKHFAVTKQTKGNNTVVMIKELKGKENIEQISRMLGGALVTDVTRSHASELMEMAEKLSKKKEPPLKGAEPQAGAAPKTQPHD
ncbi:MAG: DNA repair protein RecN [Deltaproteobacteria bacterium]|nr:DNA repair protein RecN [Deltaproteobacteria bacterium]